MASFGNVCFRAGRKLQSFCGQSLKKHGLLCSSATVRHKATVPESDIQDVGSDRIDTALAPNMMDIGTRRIFSMEHDIFRQNVRRFFQEEVAPYHDEWEQQGHVSREVWEKAGANGLLAVDVPEEHGGIGGDFLSSAIVTEEQCYANCSGPGFPLQNQVTLPYFSAFCNDEQRQKYIPGLRDGTCIASIAMTEPGAGSDLQGIRTNAKKDGDDWILNGSKTFITNGWMSDVVIVVAVTSPEAKSAAHGISLFLVDTGTPGYKKGKMLKKLGFKAQDTCELFFEDVRLPSSALLGKPHHGFFYLMQKLPVERLCVGLAGLATCETMFEQTREYVKQRKAFGKTLSHLQTIQHKLAEMKTEICITRAFLDNCIALQNEGKLDSQQASMAKYWATELENRVAYQCLQMHGGMGYMQEMPIGRAYLDCRVMTIFGGASEIMKELIARPIIQ